MQYPPDGPNDLSVEKEALHQRIAVLEAELATQWKRAEQTLQRSTERLEILVEASRVFAETSSDYPALLHRVARVTAETLRAACNIRLLSDDGQWLELAVTEHFDPAAQAAMQAVLAPGGSISMSARQCRWRCVVESRSSCR